MDVSVPARRYGPRTIDLVLYGDEIVDEPGAASRTRGWQSGASCSSLSTELDPDLVVPVLGPIQALLSGLE